MTKIVGHRGAAGLAPENTLQAIRAALRAGADQIELNICVANNGNVVLCRDPAQADYPHHPLLEDALALVKHTAVLFLNVTPGIPTEPIIDDVQHVLRRGWLPTDFMFASRSQKTLLALHAALPKVPTVVIEPWSGMRATYRARQLRTTFIAMNQHVLWWLFIGNMHHAGYRLYAYTLNDPKKVARWERHGLYGVITDYPNTFSSRTAANAAYPVPD